MDKIDEFKARVGGEGATAKWLAAWLEPAPEAAAAAT